MLLASARRLRPRECGCGRPDAGSGDPQKIYASRAPELTVYTSSTGLMNTLPSP